MEDANIHTLHRGHNSSFAVETRRTIFFSRKTFFPVSLAYYRPTELSLVTRLLDRFPLPFSFSAVSCSSKHVAPFEHELFLTSKIDHLRLVLRLIHQLLSKSMLPLCLLIAPCEKSTCSADQFSERVVLLM